MLLINKVVKMKSSLPNGGSVHGLRAPAGEVGDSIQPDQACAVNAQTRQDLPNEAVDLLKTKAHDFPTGLKAVNLLKICLLA